MYGDLMLFVRAALDEVSPPHSSCGTGSTSIPLHIFAMNLFCEITHIQKFSDGI